MLTAYKEPPIIEVLVNEVEEGYMNQYLSMDHEIWTLEESKLPGYLGKDTWINKTYPNRVIHIIYWQNKEVWKNISPDFIEKLKRKADACFPKEKVKRVKAYHLDNELYKLLEFRNDRKII